VKNAHGSGDTAAALISRTHSMGSSASVEMRKGRATDCSAAFEVRYGSARASLEAHRPGAVTKEDVQGLVLAGWSACHGFATLALTANLSEHLHADTATLAAQVVRGIITLGELAQRASDG
jgi:hypothetical protein